MVGTIVIKVDTLAEQLLFSTLRIEADSKVGTGFIVSHKWAEGREGPFLVTNKHVLFGQQEGLCNGCKGDFPFKLFEVDHIVPRSRGGTDHLANLQLLCSSCNRIKGDRPQEYLVARLAEIEA